MFKKILCLIISITLLNSISVYANNKHQITELKYGIFVKKIVPNFKENKFYAEFYWWIKFHNDSSKSGLTNSDIINLQYVNGCETPNDAFVNEIQEKKELSSSYFYYTGYHQGYFFFTPDFTNYPFDKQKLSIEIEHSILPVERLVISSDSDSYIKSNNLSNFYGVSEDLLIQSKLSLKIIKTTINTTYNRYNSDFGDPEFSSNSKYSRISFIVDLDRIVAPYITKFFIPLAIILFLVYFVFFIKFSTS